MSDLFMGSTTACLQHFFTHYKWEEAQECLAVFCDVKKDTVRRWKTGEVEPKGESLVKIRVILDLLGYGVQEFQELYEVTRQLARLIAFGLLDADGVQKGLVYETRNGVFDLILRGTGVMPDRAVRLRKMVEESEEVLEEYTTDSKAKLAALPRVAPTATPPRPPAPRQAQSLGAVAVSSLTVVEPVAAEQAAEPLALALAHQLQSAAVLTQAVVDSPDAVRLWDGVAFMVGQDVLRRLRAALDAAIR